MTPNVRSASKLISDPTQVMWFDVGQMPEYSEQRAMNIGRIMHPPFDRCAICGLDADGDMFVITTIAAEKSLAIGGTTRTAKGMLDIEPFAVIQMDDGSLGLHRAKDQQQARAAVVMIDEWLARMDVAGCQGYQPVITTHPINRQRLAKGKRPLHYTWRTVVVSPRKAAGSSLGGTHASPRMHERRGHWRKHPSGKTVWVKQCRVGDASRGAVFKDYKVKA